MSSLSLKEFRPTILFLAKFVGIYVIMSLLYGAFISSYEPLSDPPTHVVAVQTSSFLNVCGWTTRAVDSKSNPTTVISSGERRVLAVYEGCNGLNVMIIFVAFVFAFGPLNNKLLWFIPAGLLTIHLANLSRIILLFWVSLYQPNATYFLHKYLFTAFLYVVVFVLWIVWVRRYSRLRSISAR
ncbi:MAG: exosortase family protein XrtF [Chryseolinea sp.]